MIKIKLETLQKCFTLIFNVKFELVLLLLIMKNLVEIQWLQSSKLNEGVHP
jgi:hypothetical protein